MATDNSLKVMQRIRIRLVEEARRLQYEAERLDLESKQLANEARNLDQLSVRLKGRVVIMQARSVALLRLADELSDTASMAESVGQLYEDEDTLQEVARASEGDDVPPESG